MKDLIMNISLCVVLSIGFTLIMAPIILELNENGINGFAIVIPIAMVASVFLYTLLNKD